LDGGADGTCRPGKMRTAAEPGSDEENAHFKPGLIDARTGEPVVPNGSLGHRYGESGAGRWNLDLGDVDPELSMLGAEDGESALVDLPRFDNLDGTADSLPRGVPVRRVGDHLVTTVYDLMLAQ